MKNENEIDSFIKNKIIEYSTTTLDLEKSREDNIYRNANSMITCISILLVAIMSIIFELLNRLEKSNTLIIDFGCILVFILLLSLCFSISAHWFYKGKYTRTGKELLNYVNEHQNQYLNENGFLDQKINDIDSIYLNMSKNNDRRRNLLIISMLLLYTFLFLMLIFAIVILIVEV